MERKEIQELRMKGYFIKATKELLKGEGLRSVNVRSIAERAGYSYATLYNYFKDVKELVFYCVRDFQDECQEFINEETSGQSHGMDKIAVITLSYMKFFIQYPGVFELFFLEKVHDIGNKQPTLELITTFLNRLCEKEWEYCINQGIVTQEESQMKQHSLTYLTTGMLLHYLNRRQPDSYQEMMTRAKRLIQQQLA